jgi:acyl-coenzyme A synthetase/AMP-(fatty) acid ligase
VNVTDPIRRFARATPGAPAFVTSAGQPIAYDHFDRTIDAVARRALALGLQPGQCAALASASLYRQLVIALALARIGVAHGPISLPAHVVNVAIADGNVAYGGNARRLDVDEIWAESAADAEPVAMFAGGDATYLYCPTSGTTSTPKFVPLSHAISLGRSQARVATAAAVGGGRGIPATRLASFVGPGTSYGFSSALLMLHGGGAVVEPTFAAEEMPGWFARSGVNYLIASPIAIQKVLQAMPAGFIPNTLELIEVGGAALPRPVYEEARARLCLGITMNYGLTECGRVASAPMHVVQQRLGGVGFPYADIELRVVDEHDRPVPPGEEGLLCIRSGSNARGYLDHPAATALVFRDGWVYPGDRATVDADGYLRVLGRADDVINRGGAKVHPQVLEDAMLALGDVQEVAVFAVEHGAGVPSVCAAVVPAAAMDADAYHQRCRERLGASAPALIVHLPELPRNAMGKVQRNDLAKMVLEIEKQRNKVGD